MGGKKRFYNRGRSAARNQSQFLCVKSKKQRVAFMTILDNTKGENLILSIDSGCSDHLINNKNVFYEYICG